MAEEKPQIPKGGKEKLDRGGGQEKPPTPAPLKVRPIPIVKPKKQVPNQTFRLRSCQQTLQDS